MIKRMPGSEATSVWHSQESPHPLALSFLILVMWFHVKLWTIYWTIYSFREIKNCTCTKVERRRPGTESTYVLHSQESLHPLALSFLILVMYLHVKLLTIFSSREIKNYARTKVERRPGTESTYVLHLQESLHPLALSFLILVMYLHVKLLTIFSSREIKNYTHTKVERRRPGTKSTCVLHSQESLHPLALSFLILVMYFHDKLLTIFSSRELKKYPHIQR